MARELFIATRKGLLECQRGADGWKLGALHFRGDCTTMLLPNPHDGTLYAGLNLGHFGAKLRRRRAGSSTWEDCGVPHYPDGAEISCRPASPDVPPASKPATLTEIWSLEAADPARPESLWAGTIPGGLFYSDDAGATWTLNRPLWDQPARLRWFGGGKDDPGLHSICVNPANSQHVTVAISCGGVWRSFDGGASWTNESRGMRADFMPPNLQEDPDVQDPHRLVQCPADPQTLWVQHHNGVFRSTDGGVSWQEFTHASPSVFGFAVVVHPRDPNLAWFVPATKDEFRYPVNSQFVASRTRDGGRTFETLDRGLPPAPSFDLVYRHALDISADGSLLAMGSTTGGLWISEDGGDSWQTVSLSLPPIYCVRFGA